MSIHDEEVLGKAYDSVLMRRLLGYLRPYKAQVGIALAAIISASTLQLAQPYLMKLAIDRHIATGDLAGLDRIAVAFLVILVLSFALEFLQTWTLQLTGQRIMYDLRMQIYRHLQRLDVQFYDRNPVGRLMTRVTTDVDVLNDLFTAGVVSIFGDVFMLIGIMVVLVVMDWRLALIAFSVLPLIVVVTQWFRRNARESYRLVRTWIARINAFLQEHITGMSTVQLFRQERQTFERFEAINRTHRDANVQSIFYYAVFYPAIEVIGALASALIIWFGGGWNLQGTLTLGSLVAFLQYAQRFFRPISDMSEKFNVLQAAMASSERIFKLLDTPVRIGRDAPALEGTAVARRHQRGTSGAIAFENVTFGYADGEPVLRNVSFQVRPGERVGIVGATGAGKSTLINLLLRFYDVTGGRILVDGEDVRTMDLDVAAVDVQPGPAGRASVLRHDRGKCQARQYEHHGRTGADGGSRGARRPVRRPAAGPLRAPGGRAGRHPVGRPEAAALLRSSARIRPLGPDPGRGDVERGYRDRAADPGRPPRADGRPHHAGDCPSAVDHPGHGQDPGPAQGGTAGGGHAPGAAGPARDLSQAVSAPVQGAGAPAGLRRRVSRVT